MVQLSTHHDELRLTKSAGDVLAVADVATRRAWLERLATALETEQEALLAANRQDLEAARAKGVDDARYDRMRLDAGRLAAIAAAVREIAGQDDPLAERLEVGTRPSGVTVSRVRSPLGLIAMIYEARPNVTIDAAALAVFAGNAIVLRPGREIRHTAQALGRLIAATLAQSGLPAEAVRVLDDPDRLWFQSLLGAVGIVDLLIPRGGEGLIRAVQAEAKVPVLCHATGVCHTYIDREADLAKAVAIAVNAKAQRPGVCNATEGLLIDRALLDAALPALTDALVEAGVTLHGSPELAERDGRILPDGDQYRGHEWLSLDLTVQAVDGLDGAIGYIRRYGSQHTEAIVTENPETARHFLREVQASAVMHNASTRFNDGGELGLGAEIGISTTKLHAFGPMGLAELTAQKFVVHGDGQIRG